MMQILIDLQRSIHDAVSSLFNSFAEAHDWRALLILLPLGIVFGAVHALTPGHSKVVLASYLVGSRAGAHTQRIGRRRACAHAHCFRGRVGVAGRSPHHPHNRKRGPGAGDRASQSRHSRADRCVAHCPRSSPSAACSWRRRHGGCRRGTGALPFDAVRHVPRPLEGSCPCRAHICGGDDDWGRAYPHLRSDGDGVGARPNLGSNRSTWSFCRADQPRARFRDGCLADCCWNNRCGEDLRFERTPASAERDRRSNPPPSHFPLLVATADNEALFDARLFQSGDPGGGRRLAGALVGALFHPNALWPSHRVGRAPRLPVTGRSFPQAPCRIRHE